MNMVPRTPPAPTEGQVGDMIADLPSKTIWLRVSAAENPTGAVLLSDIDAIADAIDASNADAKAYTDLKLAGDPGAVPPVPGYAKLQDPVFTGDARAPTPLLTDNDTTIATTAFVQALLSTALQAQQSAGTIIWYAGPLSKIGVGKWANWRKCDGAVLLRADYPDLFDEIGTIWTGSTVPATSFQVPDFRDRFMIGAGNVGAGLPYIGGLDQATDIQGAHTHGGTGGTILSVNHLPAHHHGVGTLDANLVSGSGTTNKTGAHQHKAGDALLAGSAGGAGMRPQATGPFAMTDVQGDHQHTVTLTALNVTIVGATADTGNAQAHTHPISSDGNHQHGITAAKIKNAIPSALVSMIIKVL